MSELLRAGFRMYGNFDKIFGSDAKVAAEMLDADEDEDVYRFEADNPAKMAAKKGIMATRSMAEKDDIRAILAPGKVRVIVFAGNVYTVKRQMDKLIEDESE